MCLQWGTPLSAANSHIRDSNLLFQAHFANRDEVLDDILTLEEVETAVFSLKNGKSGGIDGLTAEHLKYSGPTILVWLRRVFNSIIKLEAIPPSLNSGLVTPVFKGKGRDSLNPDSYRGITVNSIIAKCFEKAIFHRLWPILEEKGFPHPSQSAFVKDRSCADGIFSTTEVGVEDPSSGG